MSLWTRGWAPWRAPRAPEKPPRWAEEAAARAVRISFKAGGRGIVEVWAHNVPMPGARTMLFPLLYPQQGRFVGSLPVDIDYAAKLTKAARALNAELERLCS